MHPLSRLLAALFGLWFAVVIGDPGVLHACPMHGGHGAGHKSVMTSGHAGHGEHGRQAGDASSVTGAGQHENIPAPCTCVGHCCAAPTVAPVPMVATLHVPEAVTHERQQFRTPSCDVPAAPDLRLPFANGPPTA